MTKPKKTAPTRNPRQHKTKIAALTALALTALTVNACTIPPTPKPLSNPTPHNYQNQKLDWQPCEGNYQCATAKAPLNWENPEANPQTQITLQLIRQPATKGKSKGSLFLNPGGPGVSGYTYLSKYVDYTVTKRLQEQYDIVSWDPRGVGKSNPVKCYNDKELDNYIYGTSTSDAKIGSEQWIEESQQQVTKFGEACQKNTGPLLAHIDTLSTVHDLDMLRQLVGEPKLNYLGYSYGTIIGIYYAREYPKKVGRLVLDGVADPAQSDIEASTNQVVGFEHSLQAYTEHCLQNPACPLTGTTKQAMQQIKTLLKDVDKKTLKAHDGRTLTSNTLLTAIIYPLYNKENWFIIDRIIQEVSNNNPQTAFYSADLYYSRENGQYTDNSFNALIAISCLDYPRHTNLENMQINATTLKIAAPTIGEFQGYTELACQTWPEPSKNIRGDFTINNSPPILLVGTTGDPATPYSSAVKVHKKIKNSVLLTNNDEGHTAYRTDGTNNCIVNKVDTYLLDGQMPANNTSCN